MLDDVADATERAAGALRHEVKRSEDFGPSADTDPMMGHDFPQIAPRNRSRIGAGAVALITPLLEAPRIYWTPTEMLRAAAHRR